MDKIKVLIHIIPTGVEMKSISGFSPITDGKVLSTSKQINVNKASYGYSIIIDTNTIMELQKSFVNEMINLFIKNLGNNILLDVSINYYSNLNTIDNETKSKILMLSNYLWVLNYDKTVPNIIYTMSDSVNRFYYDYSHRVQKSYQPEYDYLESLYDDKEDDEEDDYDNYYPEWDDYLDEVDDNYEDEEYGSSLMRDVFGDEEDDDLPRRDISKYGISRVLSRADNPKRDVNKHGVIIASSKKDIKKDRKILKEFLEEFIPGNSKWKEEFREDILNRWIQSFTVTKKQLKSLEKAHRKSIKENKRIRRSGFTNKAIEITSRIFSPRDRWDDPTK